MSLRRISTHISLSPNKQAMMISAKPVKTAKPTRCKSTKEENRITPE